MRRVVCLTLAVCPAFWAVGARAQPRPGTGWAGSAGRPPVMLPFRCGNITPVPGWQMSSPSMASGMRGEFARFCQIIPILETGQPAPNGPFVLPYTADPVQALVALWQERASLTNQPGFAAEVGRVWRVPGSNAAYVQFQNQQKGQPYIGYALVQSSQGRPGQWNFGITLVTAPSLIFRQAAQAMTTMLRTSRPGGPMPSRSPSGRGPQPSGPSRSPGGNSTVAHAKLQQQMRDDAKQRNEDSLRRSEGSLKQADQFDGYFRQ
jgi:hypothetical protein